MTALTVPLISRRRERALLVQKIQHVIPAPVLLGHGISRLSEGATGLGLALGVAEIGTSALVIGSFARAIRRRFAADASAHQAHGVDWTDIFLGLMLFVEVVVHRQETGHIQRPTLLLATTMIAMGLAHRMLAARIAKRRVLRVDDRGISAGGRFFRRFSAAWSEVAEIAIGPQIATVITRDGRERVFDLRDLQTAPAVRDALVAAEARWRQQPGAQPI